MNKTDNGKIYTTRPNYNFERVDIFLRVKGRLPNHKEDSLTQKILDEYCEKYEKNELTEGIVPLKYMYNLIKSGNIKITNLNKLKK